MTKAREKIKIVRIITRLNIGGPAIHTILLSNGLGGFGYESILITGKPSDQEGDMTDFARANGVKPILLSELGRDISFRNDTVALFKLYSILKKEKPDIVHTHTAKAGTIGRMAAILAGVPIKVHTFHGHVLSGYFGPFKTKFFTAIEKFLGVFTDKVIVVSESVRDQIVGKLKIVPDDKCAVIKLGFDLKDFLDNDKLKGIFRKEFNIASDVLLIGIVGRLVPIKNHKMFLNVIRKVMDNKSPGLNLKFLIIGDGELRRRLEEDVRDMGLSNAVIFTGWVKDIAKVYADLDIIVLTSLNEGTPVSLIEAMASARPVVATSVGGVVDIVFNDKNGLLVGSNDVEGFAGALLKKDI